MKWRDRRLRLTSVLRGTLGTPGLLIGLVSLLMFGFSLVVLKHEYNRLSDTRSATLQQVFARWVRTTSSDYLGRRSLIDDADLWRRSKPANGTQSREQVAFSLARMGRWLEEQNRRSPLIEVVEMWLYQRNDPRPVHWQSHAPSTTDTRILSHVPVLPPSSGSPAVALDVRYRIPPEYDRIANALETSYRRLLLAVLGLSGYSLLCLGYMALHAQALRDRAARESAQQATLDLADRTCHELGNVAFVLSNERRNLTEHLALVERFLDEESTAMEAASRRVGMDSHMLERFRSALRREYAARGIDPDVELRTGASLARDVCRQIAVCSDYIALTVRELDSSLKQNALPVVREPLIVESCIQDALTLLGPSLEAAAVRVERPDGEAEPIRAHADRRLLVHALVNLLKNAVEATTATTSAPRITVTTRRNGSSVQIEVADNGPGIPKDRLQRIFESGYSTKGAGRGRGLSIVKDSIEAQGGNLQVVSEPGRGTTFRVSLPVASEKS